MTIKLKVIGEKELADRFRKLPSLVAKEVKKEIAESGSLVQGNIIRLVSSGARSGKFYGSHQASAPGEPPAKDTGTFLRSVFNEPSKSGFAALVGSDVKYAKWLEFGTRKAGIFAQKIVGKTGGGMAPRPWLQNTFDRNKEKISRKIQSGFRRGIKKSKKFSGSQGA